MIFRTFFGEFLRRALQLRVFFLEPRPDVLLQLEAHGRGFGDRDDGDIDPVILQKGRHNIYIHDGNILLI